MPWLVLLHISAVVCWCGSLLYMPALLAGAPLLPQAKYEESGRLALSRLLFTYFVTPAALVAVASGTLVFVTGGIVALWLILKLTLVAGLVFCHVLTGLLLVYAWHHPQRNPMLPCLLLGAVMAGLILAVLGLVLTKPF
ncbi:MAG: CopD family protein [Methylohalobius sp. ZOD2]|nr:CopD family protein [Methylothermaceae bacterium]